MINRKTDKAMLIIMDGWGHGKKDSSNAIYQAETPFIDGLYKSVPNAELRTDGENVGLPTGQMGNSEVGHINIGAGRVVYQDLVKINKSIEKKEFFVNPVLVEALATAKQKNVKVHLIGLLSDGGIHSTQDHLHALLSACNELALEDVFVHAFTDGRDTDPKGGIEYLKKLSKHIESTTGHLASVVGRFYAMDRDKRWERTKVAYDLLTKGDGYLSTNVYEAVQSQYNQGITDEFLKPIACALQGEKITIDEGDVVICFNYRTDRCRQITTVLTQENQTGHGMETLALHYYTMTRYDHTFQNIGVLFDKDNLAKTIGEVIEENAMTQVRMAETEKYPHVTFFLSGGREKEFVGESRVMANSPKVKTYDLQPEMSAVELKDKAIQHIIEHQPNLCIINFANPDMVGHTGVVPAIIKAVQTTDLCCKELSDKARNMGYEILIIADHGNAELNVNDDGSAHTAHTLNPVPIFYLGEKFTALKSGILADVAPSLLILLGLNSPEEMTGENLLN
ncbi:MAG: 2,3-bisphosphoglycerate-independent phosphoglycerate mutase [Patiriisocius sp.]|jgi:2,3-bisphosphoglycerate-independent phosphoglycerate mutase